MTNRETVDFEMPPAMAARLGHYVYLYLDPDSKEPLYVGKGKGKRILAHLAADGDDPKGRRMRELREAGRQPELRFLRHGLSEEEAFLVEAATIDAIGLDRLVNKVVGHGSRARGAMSFEQLRATFVTEDVEIADPVVMIRVSRSFRYDMPAEELYEATRGTWVIGPRRDQVRYALAVAHDVIHEVYGIERWQPAGTRPYLTRDVGGPNGSRWEFEGRPVPAGEVRERYLHKKVSHLFSRGSQNPIRYAFPDDGCGRESESRRRAA